MAVLSYVNGEIELALTQMKRASELFDLVLGSDHPESWDVKTNLTALLNMAQRFDEAIEIIEPVFNKQSDILGASHKSTIYSQTVLARLYGDVGRLNEAQQLAEEMLNTAINELGFDHPLTVGGHFTLAKVLQKQGNFSTAIALIQSVIKSDGWRDDNERVITAYNTLADLYMANDEVLAAAEFKEKSLQVSIDLLTKDSPRTLSQMVKNTEFYILINDQVKAQSYIDRMVELLESEADGNNALKLKLAEFQQAILTKSP
jgi:tetratricopeptide (TPR) repeat protein